MRILDRYILKSFLINYLLAMSVLLGMYVLLDLIVNVQDFAKGASAVGPAAQTLPAATATEIARDMVDYYSYQLLVIFQQISGVIPLLAAGFTMIRMTRHHELTAMLASGVSLYRVAAPIILTSMVFSVVHVLNQELIISQPAIIEKLLRKHDEVNVVTAKAERLDFIKDANRSLLLASSYDANPPGSGKPTMKNVFIIDRDLNGRPLRHRLAASATWEILPGEAREAWVLRDVASEDDTGLKRVDAVIQNDPIQIYKTSLTPKQIDLVISNKAVDFLSSSQVQELAKFSPDINKPMLYKIMHLRFTQPLMNIIMLLVGIPFLLTREPNRLVINMFFCTAISGFMFVATFVIFQMGGTQIDPLLGAWLPVLIFGPFAVVMMDFIKT